MAGEYFENLYQDEAVDTAAGIPSVTVMEEKQEPGILIVEVRAAIKAMKNNKASDHDDIEAELLQALGEDAEVVIWKSCREI